MGMQGTERPVVRIDNLAEGDQAKLWGAQKEFKRQRPDATIEDQVTTHLMYLLGSESDAQLFGRLVQDRGIQHSYHPVDVYAKPMEKVGQKGQ